MRDTLIAIDMASLGGLRQLRVDESFRSGELIDDDRTHGLVEVIGATI